MWSHILSVQRGAGAGHTCQHFTSHSFISASPEQYTDLLSLLSPTINHVSVIIRATTSCYVYQRRVMGCWFALSWLCVVSVSHHSKKVRPHFLSCHGQRDMRGHSGAFLLRLLVRLHLPGRLLPQWKQHTHLSGVRTVEWTYTDVCRCDNRIYVWFLCLQSFHWFPERNTSFLKIDKLLHWWVIMLLLLQWCSATASRLHLTPPCNARALWECPAMTQYALCNVKKDLNWSAQTRHSVPHRAAGVTPFLSARVWAHIT